MLPDRLIFFNPGNNGDLHVSRELVKYTMATLRERKPSITFAYSHKNHPEILRDIDGLEHVPLLADFPVDRLSEERDDRKTLVWNTWYAVSPSWAKGNGSGCSLYTLYELFRAHLRSLDFPIDARVDRYIPTIDFDAFYTIYAQDRMERGPDSRRVLFCSNTPLSGQSRVDDGVMMEVLHRLAAQFPGVDFIHTSDRAPDNLNIHSAKRIIGPPPWKHNLNETAFFATACDVIVGRSTGPHTFCLNQSILNDPTKTFITFCEDPRLGKWAGESTKARVLWTPAADVDGLVSSVAEALQ